MIKLPIKPISLNHAYSGRRFTTPELKQFKSDVSKLLPKLDIPQGKLEMHYKFGVSSKNSDVDNLIKAFQDCLAECWGFNDKLIYRITVEKTDTKKGDEFIAFSLSPFNTNSLN